MSQYNAPIRDMQFVMRELAGLDEVMQLPGNEEVSADLVDAILEEADKFASGVLAPLNWTGDQEGAKWKRRRGRHRAGLEDAYTQFAESGWTAPAVRPGIRRPGPAQAARPGGHGDVEVGQHGLLAVPDAHQRRHRGADAARHRRAEGPVPAEDDRGRMDRHDEPHRAEAGSDLAAVRTKAEPQGDGTYEILGQKIFITYGEHDLTDNIIHLVLARPPDAPEGAKGISLFVVPKFMVDADGSLGARTACTACRSSTSSASTPRPPPCSPSATRASASAT